MVTERCVALWKRKKYEKFGGELGFALAAFSVLAAFALTAWALRRAEYSDKPYCSSSTPATLARSATIYIILCGVSITALIGVVLLFTTNRMAVKKKHFDLTSSYQLNENYTVIRLLLPHAVFHSLCYIFFTILSTFLSSNVGKFEYVTFRMLFSLTYIIPVYTAISQIMMWFITKYSKRLKTTRLNQATQAVIRKDDVYFSGYSKMWT
ncbi:unnamed protein product [Cylicocyclus nassatus]|uniref:Uncharacterized protein n=1 Tax=Cylicocyclus nassatus TaxID=53992 RepID=A0AA36HD27_CYLNA|nr:unnamed protein product [Cylicocyclus nassatus]